MSLNNEQPDKNGNKNCLHGYECPHCGHSSSLLITALSTFKIMDDGTDSHDNVEYDESAPATCPGCSFSGQLTDFRIGSAESRRYVDITRE